jgi:hypothetical protein
MCNNCIHKAVCSKYTATGGHVRECEHVKEDRRGRWISWAEMFPKKVFAPLRRKDGFCSYCGAMRKKENYCPNCGADMKGETK